MQNSVRIYKKMENLNLWIRHDSTASYSPSDVETRSYVCDELRRHVFFNGVAIYPCCAPPCPRAHPFGKTLPTNVLSLKRLLGSQFGPTFVLFIICLLCPNVHENLAHSVVQHVSLLFVYPFVFTHIFTKIIEKGRSGPFFRLANLFCGMDG